KFRCQHCRQFLGISRAKAGAVVDCPTCGRALRVPRLDGTIEPLPEPGMDLADSGLSEALEELAQIADSRLAVAAPTDRDDRRRGAAVVTQDEAAPALLPPLPDPVPVDPPAPVRPASSPAGMKVKPLPKRAARAPSEPEESDESEHPILKRARKSTAISNEMIELIQAGTAATPDEFPTTTPKPADRRGIWSGLAGRVSPRVRLVLALCGIGAVALAAGFVLGRAGGPADGRGHGPAAAVGGERSESAGERSALGTAKAAGLVGRITYEAERGDFRADAGARIIAFPATSSTGERLPARRLIDETQRAAVATQLAAAGGGFAVADENGRFALSLQKTGVYRVLVVSEWRPRQGEPLPAGVVELAGEWLDSPETVTEKRSCRVREISYSSGRGVPFDCVFEEPH
ncbi:MAG TPA: hypothetical protein VML55_20930, partial [Planctomycetaceae bacterium]|nr:hypothetical protein [Planctomycetaceae bacterium]